MSKACVYAPKRATSTFYRLKKAFGYNKAWDIWYAANSNNFLNKYKDSLTLDSEGFPTYESLIDNEGIRSIVSKESIGSILSSKYKSREDNANNYKLALQEAYEFNSKDKNRDNYVAIVNSNNNTLKVDIVPKNKNSVEHFKNQYSSYLLNTRLVNILNSLGVTVGTLTDLETQNGRVGVTDFNIAKQLANDTIEMIKIANNMEGENALSEEFSHLIIGTLRNTPLMSRTINQLADEDLLMQILGSDYDDVFNFYDGNLNLMAEEALGHILRDRLRSNVNTSLLTRLINYIKGLFKKINPSQVGDAIAYSESMMNDLANNILKGTIKVSKEDIRNSNRDAQFNALSEKIDRNINILKRASEVEAKRYKILGTNESQARAIDLRASMNEDADTALGICQYAKTALDELRSLQESFKFISTDSPKNRFSFLRSTRSILQSYGKFIKDVNDARVEDENDSDNMFLNNFNINGVEVNLNDTIRDLNDIVQTLTRSYFKLAIPTFAEFLRPILGDEITVEMGKNAGKKITLNDLITKADRDISFMDRWLDSMANSSDILLQAFDVAVKTANDKARIQSINDIKEIQALQQDAEKLGITDWNWIYEKDKNGNNTGFIISEINEAQYNKDLKEFEDKLNKKYGKNPKGEDLILKKAERKKWHSIHSVDNLFWRSPNPEIYTNQDYVNLDQKHKDILNRYLNLKNKIDNFLPKDKVSSHKAIQMRKDGIQRFIDSTESPSNIWSNMKNHLADEFLEREDDENLFGDNTITKGLTDFAGNEFMVLPVMYTTSLKDPNDLTNDAIGALMAYTAMGNRYAYMSDIIDPLEVGRSIIQDGERKVSKTQGNQKLAEKFKTLGITVISDILEPSGSNIEKKLNDFFASQVYGKYLKKEGSFEAFGKKFSGTKIANWIMKGSSTAMLGFNFLANLANITTGVAMQNIEAAASEYFTASQLASADATYFKLLPEYLAELNSRNKQSKLALLDELFNIKGDFFDNVKRNQRKGILSRIFGASSTIAFLGQNVGDHWLYNRTLIAMMKNTLVNVPGKGKINLFEAYQIRDKYKDKNIKELYLPVGTTDENGNIFDVGKFSRKVLAVNQKLFGIYNTEDKNAAKRLIAGRAILQFRDWIKPQMNARFEKAQYNAITKQWEEGYYRTFARISYECLRGQRRLNMLWSSMTTKEKQNIRRALFEWMQFGAIWALCNFIEWDKDKKRPWGLKLIEYILNRSKHELGFLAPQPTTVNEALANIKSPAACLSMIGSIGTMMESLVTPNDWTNTLQSGPYKGMSNVEKNFLKLPLPVINQYRQVNKVIDDDAFMNNIRYYMKPSAY